MSRRRVQKKSPSRKRIKERKNTRLRTNRSKKLPLIRAIFICCITLLMVRIAYLKMFYGEDYSQRAIAQQMNSITERTLNPNRGSILDRNHQPLAISFTVYTVILDVRQLMGETVTESRRERVLTALNEILDIPMQELREHIAIDPETNTLVKNTHYLPILRQVDREKILELGNLDFLIGVYWEDDTKRTYIHNTLAAQVIGFQRGDAVWGLENVYNSNLVGESGRIFRTFNQNRDLITQPIPAIPGNTIVSTLDLMIQQFAEESVVKWGSEYEVENASAIVMNPNTGEIYAMATYPSFDLNDPANVSSVTNSMLAQEWSTLSSDEQLNNIQAVWRNFNITDTFEPGSIFKPITVAAALEEGIISTNDIFICNGSKPFRELFGQNPFNGIPCHRTSGHGEQTLVQALANSCNVAMMEIVEKMGREVFFDYQRDFGYGQWTGIDLSGETDVSSPILMYTLDRLNNVELATSSIGQGFNATPIQAITSFAAIINGGYLYQPYLVSQILDSSGMVVQDFSPNIKRKVISRETSSFLRTAMEKTVSEGTGTRARIEGYSIGGKTGTGQQGNRDDGINTLSFTTYFPVENPEFVVQVILHRVPAHIEGATPAHMIRELMENIINYTALPPSYDISTVDTSSVSQDRIMPDFSGQTLRQTVNTLHSMGVSYQMVGSSGSIVTSQSPVAGSVITDSVNVLLFIGADEDGATELVSVPDVIGMDAESAMRIIQEHGFDTILIEVPNGTGLGENMVFEQVPESNVRLATGSYVTIRVPGDTE